MDGPLAHGSKNYCPHTRHDVLGLMRNFLFPAVLAIFPTTQASAHPHVFVEVSVAMIYEGDAPSAVRLTWTYDDYFSLLLMSDLGLDEDGDTILTAQELDILTASVKDWPADYDGDLEVLQNGRSLPLGPKEDHIVTYEDGVVHETHTRPLVGAIDPKQPLAARPYDPYFYVAYDVTGEITVEGRDGCVGTLQSPDLEAANAQVATLLDGRAASDVGATEEFPAVGNLFAQTVTFTCAP